MGFNIGGYNIRIPFSLRNISSMPDFLQWIIDILGYMIILSIVVAVAMLIYSGIAYITSSGDEEKIRKAGGALTAAIVGLVVVFVIRVFLLFILNTFLL